MDEISFFSYYNLRKKSTSKHEYYSEWIAEEERLKKQLPDLPFSNIWLCQQTAPRLPTNSVLHLGILNSLRSWNLFDTPKGVYSYSNVGGFGIDGCISSCIGAALSEPEKIFICVLGDLATFYDLNSLGNRHISPNIRVIVSNNGAGFEMRCAGSLGKDFGYSANQYMAAAGHFGNRSHALLKHFAEDLGFEYKKADNKEEYLALLDKITSPQIGNKPMLIEVFVEIDDDNAAYDITKNLATSASGTAKQVLKGVLGEKGYEGFRKIIKRN